MEDNKTDKTDDTKFWVLWCPTYPKPPTKRYETFEQARAVGASMATKQPGDEFHVLECVATYQAEKPVEPKLKKVERKESKKEREAREANLAKETSFLSGLAVPRVVPTGLKPPGVPNTNPFADDSTYRMTEYKGISGPMSEAEKHRKAARDLIGKRVKIVRAGAVYGAIMDVEWFRKQVAVGNRGNCTYSTWGGQRPQDGDYGKVIDAATTTAPQVYSAWDYRTPQVRDEKGWRKDEIALVVQLDRGISCVIKMDAVEVVDLGTATPFRPLLPPRKAVVPGERYRLVDGTPVRAVKGGTENLRGKLSYYWWLASPWIKEREYPDSYRVFTDENDGCIKDSLYLVEEK